MRILARCKVVMTTALPPAMIEHLGMIPASSLGEAVETAGRILGRGDAPVTVIPDGVSVIVIPD
jgi:hypothetical protein